MPSHTNSTGSSLRPKPLSPDAVWDRVDPLAADCGANPAKTGLAKLPYFKLRGPGFERLVYELLQAENQQPWFFGRTGQAQYGVDIVTEATGRQTIYQCKNYAEKPTFPEVRDAVTKFESEWLSDMKLPAPGAFVYCCPHPLDDSSFDVEWVRFKDSFQKRTSVALSFLDRYVLDTRLQRLPDLVGGLFSDSCAEHFCGRDDWRDDPWVRLQRGPARFPGINRFLDRHDRNAIYVAESHEKLFLTALDQGSTVALRGLPGIGKSFLALELACRMRQPLRRIYYATFKDEASGERLWQSARRRLSLPVVFVLDDCHLAPEAAGIVLERLGPELRGGKLKLVLILRDQAGAAVDEPDDRPEWLARLNEEQAIIDLHADPARTLAVTRQLRPEFTGLSRSRLARLHNACGGDLLLLDELLQSVATPQDIESLRLDGVLAKLRTQYFGANRLLPTITKLAALAQFDLVPQADFFDGQWQPDEEELAAPLMTRMFAPPRYQFLHSSLAELVLRALTQLDVDGEALDETVASSTANVLRNYLLHLRARSARREAGSAEFMLAIQQCLRGRLNLLGNQSEARIKAAVLGDEAIQAAIETDLGKQSFASLGLCVFLLSIAEHPAKAHYLDLVERRFRILFERASAGGDIIGILTIGTGLLTLRRNDPDRCAAVLNKCGAEGFLRLILANGTLFELFRVLQYSTPAFRTALLEQLTAAQAEVLLEKTVAAKRSIGTLHFAMRELGQADQNLLALLEQAIGAPGFLRLILANGTLFELFRVLEYATLGFRTALLEQLTSAQAAALVDQTIRAGRSIGTLNLAMRELGDADPALLGRLERVIGAPSFLSLILANGTLSELFKVLEQATPPFRTALLEHLTSTQAAALIDQTIRAGRSIGTLNLAMRELGEADHALLGRLERVIGAPGFLRLILANGTLFELFRVLGYATPKFRVVLLEQITPNEAAILLHKTVAGEARGIESLHFVVRAFAAGSDQPSRLEAVLGVECWWRLLTAAGSLNSVSHITGAMSKDFRAQMIAAATELSVLDWRGIIARGLFLNACDFATNDLLSYPESARNAFRAALIEAATPLAARASWFDLNPSRPPAETENVEGVILRTALCTRMEVLQLPELFELDFREAANALACCWRERPDLRPELGKNLRRILPPRTSWPREKGEVAALRLVLTLARKAEFPEEEARWLLAEVTAFLDREVCAGIHTLPLFLLVWNMAALSYERGLERSLAGTFPHTAQELLLAVLAERVHPKGPNQEKLWQFALAGLLAFMFPGHKTRLVELLVPLKGAVRWLAKFAMDQTFVPAVFALEGIALLDVREYVFTPAICAELLRKFEDYEDVGPALDSLRLRVLRIRDRQSSGRL